MNFPFINKTIKVKTYNEEICELGTVKFFIYWQPILVKGAFIMVMTTTYKMIYSIYIPVSDISESGESSYIQSLGNGFDRNKKDVPITDIMFLVDCTGSMDDKIEPIKQSITNFTQQLASQANNTRLGLIGFRDKQIGLEHQLHTFESNTNPCLPDIEAKRVEQVAAAVHEAGVQLYIVRKNSVIANPSSIMTLSSISSWMRHESLCGEAYDNLIGQVDGKLFSFNHSYWLSNGNMGKTLKELEQTLLRLTIVENCSAANDEICADDSNDYLDYLDGDNCSDTLSGEFLGYDYLTKQYYLLEKKLQQLREKLGAIIETMKKEKNEEHDTFNTLCGDSGGGTLHSSWGNDLLYGYDGHDYLYGRYFDDHLYGDNFNICHDYLNGDSGNDRLCGDSGSDPLDGEDNDDTLFGGADNDYLFGAEGGDFLGGWTGHDELYGGGGNDVINGFVGIDTANQWKNNRVLRLKYARNQLRLISQFSESYYQSRGSPLLIMDAYGMGNLLTFGTDHFPIKTKIKLQKNVPKYYSSA